MSAYVVAPQLPKVKTVKLSCIFWQGWKLNSLFRNIIKVAAERGMDSVSSCWARPQADISHSEWPLTRCLRESKNDNFNVPPP